MDIRERNNIEEYYKIEKECPLKCFHIDSPIEGEVIIKKNMLHKCSPENCKACINICPTKAFFIPESAEDVNKYGKIACNEDKCVYCGACENACPEILIKVNIHNIQINEPKKQGDYPWIEGWIKRLKYIIKEKLIDRKSQVNIPIIKEEVKEIKKEIEETIPQLSKEDKTKLNEINEKIQNFLSSSKIRYWIKDKKIDKITNELTRFLKKEC